MIRVRQQEKPPSLNSHFSIPSLCSIGQGMKSRCSVCAYEYPYSKVRIGRWFDRRYASGRIVRFAILGFCLVATLAKLGWGSRSRWDDGLCVSFLRVWWWWIRRDAGTEGGFDRRILREARFSNVPREREREHNVTVTRVELGNSK